MFRGVLYPLLILTTLLVGMMVWSVFHPGSLWPQIAAVLTGVTRSGSANPPAPSRAATPAKPIVKEAARHLERRPPVAMPDPAVPKTPIGSDTAERRYRFPVAADVTGGTARAAILARFGPPLVVATNADLGALRERFIYVDPATGRRTHILLINGNVTDVETSRP